ncbi:hypothetical protein CK222_13745 [Mesorhizobium sp. WSM3866]|uniref:hypothetical protein n=1 Tax=Mesorhizobium sp. WSM3866 TaxID=422271 RepID=UPI000BAE6B8F|nr:hypothetical protein [Mesorhizobium sp. WSM3866]PBB42958.1 hypothetical protein CK222_13745 [Mesorhizobium sp. WSM3866]
MRDASAAYVKAITEASPVQQRLAAALHGPVRPTPTDELSAFERNVGDKGSGPVVGTRRSRHHIAAVLQKAIAEKRKPIYGARG